MRAALLCLCLWYSISVFSKTQFIFLPAPQIIADYLAAISFPEIVISVEADD